MWFARKTDGSLFEFVAALSAVAATFLMVIVPFLIAINNAPATTRIGGSEAECCDKASVAPFGTGLPGYR